MVSGVLRMVSECSLVVVVLVPSKAACAGSMVVKRGKGRKVLLTEGVGDNTEEGERGERNEGDRCPGKWN